LTFNSEVDKTKRHFCRCVLISMVKPRTWLLFY